MDCLFPKKEKEDVKMDWLEERRNIRKYNARLSAIIDELEDYYHYEEYKKRFKLLFDFYQLEELLKKLKNNLYINLTGSAPRHRTVCNDHKHVIRMW